MSNPTDSTTPVWTLATSSDPDLTIAPVSSSTLTPDRLAELRSALASFASTPLVTLEAHPLPKRRNSSAGIPLDAASPLAKEISRLVADHADRVPAVAKVAESSEVLYRMVVPAKVAGQVGKGLVKSMPSKAASNGFYDNLVDAASGITVAKASFVPVERAAAGAASTGAAGTAVGAAATGGAVTVAAPLVLMAVAVGASAYADHQRQEAIDKLGEMLEKLTNAALDHERNELDGCQDAIDKATALLLDRGKVGASLGLDSAVHVISQATRAATRRVRRWEEALAKLEGQTVEVTELEEDFSGISEQGGEFRAHVELAALAIALKRRVNVLQGVEAGQSEPDNPFEHFVRSLRKDQERIDELENRIQTVLLKLSNLELRSPKRLLDKLMTRKQVDDLLEASYRLRALRSGQPHTASGTDVVIEVERHMNGSLHVLPARSA